MRTTTTLVRTHIFLTMFLLGILHTIQTLPTITNKLFLPTLLNRLLVIAKFHFHFMNFIGRT